MNEIHSMLQQIMKKLLWTTINKHISFYKHVIIQLILMFYMTGFAYAQNELDARSKEISQINTEGELLNRQANVRQIMWEIRGPFPGKTPLNAKITGTVRKNYWIFFRNG
jgi:hypothetical protein